MTTSNWSSLLQQLLEGQSLSEEQASGLMRGWLTNAIPDVLSGAILAAIYAKGVSPGELVGMAQVLQALSLERQSEGDRPQSVSSVSAVSPSLPSAFPTPLVDTCGTGGDGASTFNISTAVAFVVAAAGVPVAKHGNRSASGKVGSADVLEALGINLQAPVERIQAAVSEVGITFLFAPGWHPALKGVAPLRKMLGIRTIFNLLGPLVNPLPITGQILGVSDPTLVEIMAQALYQLGRHRGMVLYGRERLDEAGLGDWTDVAAIAPNNPDPNNPDPNNPDPNNIQLSSVNPIELGLTPAPLTALVGGDVHTNGAILQAVLQGKGTQAQQEVVALNAALALEVGEKVPWMAHAEGVALALTVLRSGAAWDKLEALVAFLK